MPNLLDPVIFSSMITPPVLSPGAAGAGAYYANAVDFTDGPTPVYASHAAAMFPAGAKAFTLSVWTNPYGLGAGVTYSVLFMGTFTTTVGIWLRFQWNGAQWPTAFSVYETPIARGSWTDSVTVAQNVWTHWLISGDWNSTPTLLIYKNGVAQSGVSTSAVSSSLTLNQTPVTVGVRADLQQPLKAGMAELWMADSFFDISQASIRNKWRDETTGKPVNLGVDGSAPGVTPQIYLNQADAAWIQNQGSGTDFVKGGPGSFAAFSSSPSD